MSPMKPLGAAFMVAAVLAAGCAKQEQNPVERAVESTKDALNVRDNEKLKDAAEDVKAAVTDAKDGVKDAVTEAKEGVKDAVDGKK